MIELVGQLGLARTASKMFLSEQLVDMDPSGDRTPQRCSSPIKSSICSVFNVSKHSGFGKELTETFRQEESAVSLNVLPVVVDELIKLLV